MTEIKKIQLEVEKYCLSKNNKIPDSWMFEEKDDKFFYIEKSTGKKRYGVIKNCEYCERKFLARNSWSKSITVCSNFCGTAKRVKKVEISCSWCKKTILKTPSKLKNSKHNLYFCDRVCKENAQSIGGIEKIQPNHYKDGSASYSARAFKHYGKKCCDCNISFKVFLEVHHIDGNRNNGDISNLEVVCLIHHQLRHMRLENKKWIVDFHYLTPRDKLDELKKLLLM